MFGIEVSFYFLGFLSCLVLIAIIMEVNDKDKKNKKKLKENFRKQLKEQIIENNQEEIDIDVKIY